MSINPLEIKQKRVKIKTVTMIAESFTRSSPSC